MKITVLGDAKRLFLSLGFEVMVRGGTGREYLTISRQDSVPRFNISEDTCKKILSKLYMQAYDHLVESTEPAFDPSAERSRLN